MSKKMVGLHETQRKGLVELERRVENPRKQPAAPRAAAEEKIGRERNLTVAVRVVTDRAAGR